MTKNQKDIFMYVFAGIIITYSFVFLTLLLFKEIPDKNRDIVTLISGAVIVGGISTIYGYFFGSTKGSADKTEMIFKSKPTQETNNMEQQ